MSKAEQFRAFARECMASAESTDDIDQREALLQLATQWAFAAARLDHENGIDRPLQGSIDAAKRKIRGARGAASPSQDRGEGSDSPAK